MKEKYGFTLLETHDEIKEHIQNLSITRSITYLQVHHTWSPSYAQWPEDELTRQQSMKDYHMNTNGWGNIAQHYTVFPNGKIATGRGINSTPIGIANANTGGVCIENYGNFDKGGDSITDEQRKAIILLYGELLKKLKLTPSSTTLRYHCWYATDGTFLGDYDASRSSKTCPGTNFFNVGNTMAAFKASFLPVVQAYVNDGSFIENPGGDSGGTTTSKAVIDNIDTAKQAVITCKTSLTIRSSKSTTASSLGTVPNGATVDIVSKEGDGWLQIKYNNITGYICGMYSQVFKQFYVNIDVDSLNGRSGPSTDYDIVEVLTKGTAITIVEVRKTSATSMWGKGKAGYWINLSSSYVSFIRYKD